jgi:hypothetical protein
MKTRFLKFFAKNFLISPFSFDGGSFVFIPVDIDGGEAHLKSGGWV